MNQERDLLARLRPTPEQRAAMADAVARLEAAATAAVRTATGDGDARATVQGSIAKDTWLAGSNDVDLFLLLHPDTPAEQMGPIAGTVAARVLTEVQQKYAQHPYQMGQFDGHDVDLVPAYRVAAGHEPRSAVDRTPFHTAWVRNNLGAKQRDQVRLLKQWCKGTGTYGAETAIGGFSGYLLEVLVARFGDFNGVVAWLADGAKPRRFDWGEGTPADDGAPVQIADPVDAARNVAAAVQAPTLEVAMAAARDYRVAPDARFFFPAAASDDDADALRRALGDGAWVGLLLQPATDRIDLVYPQFQKAARRMYDDLQRAGFNPTRHRVDLLPGDAVLLQWHCATATLSDAIEHVGPAADAVPGAQRFTSKWHGHPDALTPVAAQDGRLVVTVRRHATTPLARVDAGRTTVLQGKHVQAAHVVALADEPRRVATSHDDAAVQAAAAGRIADFILQRHPWQR